MGHLFISLLSIIKLFALRGLLFSLSSFNSPAFHFTGLPPPPQDNPDFYQKPFTHPGSLRRDFSFHKLILSALALALLPTMQLAFANPLMPPAVSFYHFVEVSVSTGIFGALCAWFIPKLILAGSKPI